MWNAFPGMALPSHPPPRIFWFPTLMEKLAAPYANFWINILFNYRNLVIKRRKVGSSVPRLPRRGILVSMPITGSISLTSKGSRRPPRSSARPPPSTPPTTTRCSMPPWRPDRPGTWTRRKSFTGKLWTWGRARLGPISTSVHCCIYEASWGWPRPSTRRPGGCDLATPAPGPTSRDCTTWWGRRTSRSRDLATSEQQEDLQTSSSGSDINLCTNWYY